MIKIKISQNESAFRGFQRFGERGPTFEDLDISLICNSRVAVMRGQVVTEQGLGIVGIRVSVDRDSRFGFTLTRADGWFDVLVNGGGAVTLQFQRSPFKPLTRTVFVPWNQIVVLPPVVMTLSKEGEPYKSNQPPSPAVGFPGISMGLFSEHGPCLEHDHETLRPIIVSTWMPEKVGGLPGKSLVFAESQVSLII
ncbi:hypothetical protein HZH68_004329 [Vespula germanica]|uniref:Teneurin TTR-like domain-containing protein n=1 Tax=Vespula germanica TaxID=30212 RepID=A0A834KNK0_VESGE|nr:hypothetical protein HZH68_004329 [Vespula germanica]